MQQYRRWSRSAEAPASMLTDACSAAVPPAAHGASVPARPLIGQLLYTQIRRQGRRRYKRNTPRIPLLLGAQTLYAGRDHFRLLPESLNHGALLTRWHLHLKEIERRFIAQRLAAQRGDALDARFA